MQIYTIIASSLNNQHYKKMGAATRAIDDLVDFMIWKAWAPPKVKFFAWLAIQDRIWTADRLERRGWQNCGLCPLCKQVGETGAHLFYKCRYTIRLWNSIILESVLRTWIPPLGTWMDPFWNGGTSEPACKTQIDGIGFAYNACLLGNLERT